MISNELIKIELIFGLFNVRYVVLVDSDRVYSNGQHRQCMHLEYVAYREHLPLI
jgi:hypothetical protein